MTDRDPDVIATPPEPRAGRDPGDPARAGPPVPAAAEATAVLAGWMADNARTYTPEALERAALAAGYSSGTVSAAWARAAGRLRSTDGLVPLRARARWLVVLVYGGIWALFAIRYLTVTPSPPGLLDFSELYLPVLTVTLLAGLAIAWWVVRSGRPDPDRPTRAVALLVAVPLLYLGAVVGLCVPTLRI